METTKIAKGMQTRASTRIALADITPAAESGAMDTSPDTTSASEPEPKRSPQSWDDLCVSKDCPIKHPHNFGLRPRTSSALVVVWQDADAVVVADDDVGTYPDTQPPPLIKAMIDTLRRDPEIEMRYPGFTNVLRDFYRAHGGRSDKYHGSDGMFGLGIDLGGESGCGFCPYHKHPNVEGMRGWLAFEVKENGEKEKLVANGYY